MRILLYAGPAPSREQVLAYAAPLFRTAAQSVTLVSGGGAQHVELLHDAVQRLELPDDQPRLLLTYDGNAVEALQRATDQHEYDLVIFGRLQPALQRLIRGQRSKWLAQKLHPAALRIQGRTGPIRRVLLASGGDPATRANAWMIARLLAPLEAEVTILHVISQQSLLFEGFQRQPPSSEAFLAGHSAEALVLSQVAHVLTTAGLKTQIDIRVGLVLDEIADTAHGYDLLVIGAHRAETPLDQLLLEDIAGDLLDLSPIPVLLMKSDV
ncbi:MAG: universal stress protein [Oscillochloris sp.]|nr:universal stress protein [Oscillochloris sp.]